MSRNVFISILGTGYYYETTYYRDGNKRDGEKVRFVQEATIKNLCYDWKETDRIFIFLTEHARKVNWNSPAQTNNDNKASYEGLNERLKQLNIPYSIIHDIDIKDGNTEEETWDIFYKIYSVLNNNDTVYFDITHAFRYLPMLLMVLINYSKFLKNITVKKITYGNYEARHSDYSPIMDITAFSQLQDWTSAAHEFIQFGNVDRLVDLSYKELEPILKQTKGKDIAASNLQKLNSQLPIFVKNIQTCRGMSIYKNKEGVQINRILKESKGNLIKPLSPLLEKISETILPFDKSENVKNGFHAVDWCLRNGLIQQGITLLKETITTLICIENEMDFTKESNRNIADSCFAIFENNIFEEHWNGEAGKNKPTTRKILKDSNYIKLLSKEFTKLRTIRNDILHAGYKPSAITKAKKFENLLHELFCEILRKIA